MNKTIFGSTFNILQGNLVDCMRHKMNLNMFECDMKID